MDMLYMNSTPYRPLFNQFKDSVSPIRLMTRGPLDKNRNNTFVIFLMSACWRQYKI